MAEAHDPGVLNPLALARFITAPDANQIIENLTKLSPEVRAHWVGHLNLLVNLSAGAPEMAKVVQTALPPPKASGLDGFFSESQDGRVIERRLRGEKIAAIVEAEGIPTFRVQNILRAAQKEGVEVKITDPEHWTRSKDARDNRQKRRKHPQHILDYVVAQRQADISPIMIPAMLMRDMKYVANVHLVNALVSKGRIAGAIIPELSSAAYRLGVQYGRNKRSVKLPSAAGGPWSPEGPVAAPPAEVPGPEPEQQPALESQREQLPLAM